MARISENNWGFGAAAAAFAVLLAGCPIYADECDSRNDCASGFRCDRLSRHCEPVTYEPGCRRPDQCEVGETCTPDNLCRPGSCQYHGCVRGYRCEVVASTHTCVPAEADAASDASINDPSPNTGGSGGGGATPEPSDAASSVASDASFDADAAVDSGN